MEYQDRTLQCRDCGKPFIWTVGEQAFYATKGLVNEPARCPECRAAPQGPPRFGAAACRVFYRLRGMWYRYHGAVHPAQWAAVLCATCFSKVKPVAEELVPITQIVQIVAAETGSPSDTAAVAVAGD